MKKIRVIILTLILSISMLAPELSLIPAAYAQDETPALTQSIGSAEDAAGNTGDTASGAADAASDKVSGDSQNAGAQTDPASAASDTTRAADSDKGDTNAAGSNEGGATDQAGTPALDAADPALDAAAPAGDPATDPAEDPEEPAVEFNSYDKLFMTKLYDGGVLTIPEEMQSKIEITHAAAGKGLLFKGKISNLNSTRITIDKAFNFDEGSVGRIYFDGLRDKDLGMKVSVEIYLDENETPLATIPLKKQMGKTEWSNDGDRSYGLGSEDISGEHKVSFALKVTGKDESKKTTVMLRSIRFCKTTIPVMYFNIDESEGTIDAMNSSEDHSVECYGTVDLVVPDSFNQDETFRDEYGVQESLSGVELEYIRGRGNSTWGADKKPYKVKFAEEQDLFGFGSNKHWVLLANRFDNSLIRNRMTYWLGQQLGQGREDFTPQCVPVEVVMNGEYYGSYLLCEQVRVGNGRVEIDDLDKVKDGPALTDPVIRTGGYLLSMDYAEDKDRAFGTEHGMSFFIESPDEKVAYFNDYIKAFTQKVENAIFGEGFKDDQGHPYTDYLDMDAAVDYWWVQEFSCNGDAFGSGSTYLYKKRDPDEDNISKLYWGPLWDFDYVAWGNLDYEGEAYAELNYTQTPWFDRMKEDPEFVEAVTERWSEPGGIRDKMKEVTKEGGRLDMYLDQMETSYIYDHDEWGSYESEVTEYKGEIEQLRRGINERIENVDTAIEEMKIEDHTVTFVIDGKVVKTTVVNGFLHSNDFPEVPAKAGYVFTGWVNEETNDTFEDGSKVNADITLTAIYVKESSIVQPKAIYFRTYEDYIGASEYGDNYYNNSGAMTWYSMDYKIMPEDAWDTDIVWTSSDESIAVVDKDGDIGGIEVMGFGDVTITATLSNGVSNSYVLHVINEDDMQYPEGIELNKTSMTLRTGSYSQIVAKVVNPPAGLPEITWVSADENIATVDDLGIVTGVHAGTTYILAVDMDNRNVQRCKVTVKPKSNYGKVVKRSGSSYKITSDKKGTRTAKLIKAKNASSVTIPAYIKIGSKKYYITRIQEKAFAKSKATRVYIKTKKLTKSRVKGSLKGSKVKKIYLRTGKAKTNKIYAKKYRKIFTKKNAGKTVKVSS